MIGYETTLMKHDILKTFVTLRDSLTKEKAELEQRLSKIEEVLGGTAPPITGPMPGAFARAGAASRNGGKRQFSAATRQKLAEAQQARRARERGETPVPASSSAPKGSASVKPPRPTAPAKTNGKSKSKLAKNPISLKNAAIQLVSAKPSTRQEIIDAATKLGWKTTSKNPKNLLNPILYGKEPKFKNTDGKFSLVK